MSFAANSSAVDTDSDVSVLFTGQLASAADSVTLESYLVELYHAD
jgi:hypothetical protein